jgi:microcystin degradation protein MlrC
MMRFVTAVFRHETNTFSPLPTPLAAFNLRGLGAGPRSGDEAVAAVEGTNNPVAAFIDIAREERAELVFPIAANAHPSGPVADDAFEAVSAAVLEAVEQGCDGLFLDLHGAMVTESFDDGEGELLARVRAVAPDLPIAVALDFHTNLSARMVENATVTTGYCTYPHVDMYQTGARCGRTLVRAIKGELQPVTVWRSLPMLTHMLRQTPAAQPMKDIMDQAMAAEAGRTVLNASVFGGFPLADIPHVGLSAVVVSDGDATAAQALLDRLMGMAWERRADFIFPIEPPEASIARAKSIEEGPVILVDHGDNAGAGGNQDTMAVLAEVIRQGLEDVVVGPIWDPESVARLIEAGVGHEVEIELGGKTDVPAMNLQGEPLPIRGVVRRITDGRFTLTGPMMTGMTIGMGRTAVLDTGTLAIVVSEDRMEPFDTGVFTHAGIDPGKKRFILIKSRQHFRAGFEPIAKHVVLVAGPGVCSSNYELFPFKNLRRPIYPLDDIDSPQSQ